MKKVYQPVVMEQTENLLQGLIESEFFKDYEITDLTYTREKLLDVMTEKYISGVLSSTDDEEIFTEEEFSDLLRDLVAGSLLHELKTKGLIESYEDDTTEETFFLTNKGKDYIDNQKIN